MLETWRSEYFLLFYLHSLSTLKIPGIFFFLKKPVMGLVQVFPFSSRRIYIMESAHLSVTEMD